MPESPTPLGLVIGQLTAGGAEGQLALLAKSLGETRYRPIVYCMSPASEPIGGELTLSGVRVRTFAGRELGRAWQLRQSLRADRIRLVHAWLFLGNSYAWLATRAGGPPLVTSARNCKRQGGWNDLLNRMAFRASRKVIANSAEVARYITAEYGAPPEKIAVVYNGVDDRRFHPAEQGAEAPQIVGVGRLVPQKDPLLFVAAAAQIAAELPSARFAFVGEGPLRGQIEAAVERAGLGGRFDLPGETRDVAGVLRRATLFWLTSGWEGLPNVVLEAMASAVPVVATDVGGTRELVRDGIDGFLFERGDREALVARSLELLRNAPRRAEFARNARERAASFSTTSMLERLIALYDDVLGAEAES